MKLTTPRFSATPCPRRRQQVKAGSNRRYPLPPQPVRSALVSSSLLVHPLCFWFTEQGSQFTNEAPLTTAASAVWQQSFGSALPHDDGFTPPMQEDTLAPARQGDSHSLSLDHSHSKIQIFASTICAKRKQMEQATSLTTLSLDPHSLCLDP